MVKTIANYLLVLMGCYIALGGILAGLPYFTLLAINGFIVVYGFNPIAYGDMWIIFFWTVYTLYATPFIGLYIQIKRIK